MKKIHDIISAEYSEYPVIKYLKIIQPNWTKVFAIKMIRTGNVLVNSKKTQINYRLKERDRLELYGYSSEEVPAEQLNFSRLRPLNVVYEDDAVIIVDKEAGIPVQADARSAFNNMNNRLLKHLNWNPKQRGQKWKPVFVHRLDRNTTGLLVGAKTYRAYTELSSALKNRQIDKYYVAKVKGLVPFKTKVIRNHLLKLTKENRVVSVAADVPNAKEAISEVRLIRHIMDAKESLLEVRLITGRTHQIRSHLAEIGHPIRGDQKYGVEKDKKTYSHPQLRAFKICFSSEMDGKSIAHLRGKIFTLDTP